MRNKHGVLTEDPIDLQEQVNRTVTLNAGGDGGESPKGTNTRDKKEGEPCISNYQDHPSPLPAWGKRTSLVIRK